jgi:hypothetical protein
MSYNINCINTTTYNYLLYISFLRISATSSHHQDIYFTEDIKGFPYDFQYRYCEVLKIGMNVFSCYFTSVFVLFIVICSLIYV